MIYAWPVAHVVATLQLPSEVAIVGIKLSLDGAYVEARIETQDSDTEDLFIRQPSQPDLFHG